MYVSTWEGQEIAQDSHSPWKVLEFWVFLEKSLKMNLSLKSPWKRYVMICGNHVAGTPKSWSVLARRDKYVESYCNTSDAYMYLGCWHTDFNRATDKAFHTVS